MKTQLGYLILAVGAITLHGCDNMLGSSDAEDHKLIPEPMSGEENRPRPSADAPVITSDGPDLLWQGTQPVLMRGVNLQYGDSPLDRINGIRAIREIGSNVVRLQVRETTTADELETALIEIISNQGMLAIVSLWEPELACTMDAQALFRGINDLWLDRWLPVLIQDRFQPSLMFNLASKWGPTEIFNAHSLGYRIFIDNYKSAIRQIRRAGFAVPIVIDAPGCGQDFNAFLGNRGRELLAADDRRNLALSVHGYGSRWRNASSVDSAMRLLEGERMPVIMSEFGDFNAPDDAVRHKDILSLGLGNYAANLDIDWQTVDDKAGILVELAEPLDLHGREVSMEVYLDGVYVNTEEGADALGMQMYLRDTSERYANLGWHSADAMLADGWTLLKRVVQDASSLGWSEDGFDLTGVTKIGLELVANGKLPDVRGDIRIDTVKVIEAAVPTVLNIWTFAEDTEGWEVPWTTTEMVYQDGAMGLARDAAAEESADQVIAESGVIDGVNFDGAIQITARVLIPESYAAETDSVYFKFFSNDAGWQETNTLGAGDLTIGDWNSVTLNADNWSGGSRIGIQMGNLAGSAEPILFDDIVVMGLPEQQTAVEWGLQYQSDFSEGTDGFAVLGWHTLPVTLTTEDGVFVMTPRPSEVSGEGDNQRTFAVQKTNLNSVEHFDLTSDPLIMHLTVQLDEAYANAPYDFEFRLFIQDVNWSNHFDIGAWGLETLTPGEWVTLEVEVDFPEAFVRSGTPQHFGFQVAGVFGIPDAPIKVSELRVEGYVPTEVEEDIVALTDFLYLSDFNTIEVDFVEGGLDEIQLLESITPYERSKPFGWIAWSWIGNPAGMEMLDMSFSEDSNDDLTERGNDIVYGRGGLLDPNLEHESPENGEEVAP